MATLDNVETIIFCDETKFDIRNNEPEEAIYYLAIAVPKNKLAIIHSQLKLLMNKYRVQASVFHATTIFKGGNSRLPMVKDLGELIIQNDLKCFCYKYFKPSFFEITRTLNHLNSEIINFNKKEFQALFYFLSILNVYLKEENPEMFKREVALFFDRNVYGVKQTEAFTFQDSAYLFKQMLFTEKSNISLLALPDFVGYMFRKAKLYHNELQLGNKVEQPSELTSAAFECLQAIQTAGLFKYLEADEAKVKQALEILVAIK